MEIVNDTSMEPKIQDANQKEKNNETCYDNISDAQFATNKNFRIAIVNRAVKVICAHIHRHTQYYESIIWFCSFTGLVRIKELNYY